MCLCDHGGEPCLGIIDTGSDVTIVGSDLFKKIATVSRLKKRDFKQPDKTPVTYNQQPFELHGRMDLNITFREKTMVTPVYIKMNAHDQLLLCEGVCRQLEIVRYHPDVDEVNGQKKGSSPAARVRLVQSFSLRPYQSAIVPVEAPGVRGIHLLDSYQWGDSPLCMQESILEFVQDGASSVLVTNPTGQTCRVKRGMELGTVTPALLQEQQQPSPLLGDNSEPQRADEYLHVARVYSSERAELRQECLRSCLWRILNTRWCMRKTSSSACCRIVMIPSAWRKMREVRLTLFNLSLTLQVVSH